MTYRVLKHVTRGLLTGDNALPSENDIILGLLAYAYQLIANKAEALHLLTTNKDSEMIRFGNGDYYLRVPRLPNDEDELLDIDDELGFAAARYIASFISKDKAAIHVASAEEIIRLYNSKVYEVLETLPVTREEAYCDVQTDTNTGQ
jgi:hypothetical protein